MRTYDESISLLTNMESRFQSGFSYSDKEALDQLNMVLFGKTITNTGCSDCYRDAYVIIVNTLKQSKEMPKPTSNYSLKAGAIIHPFGTNNYYSNPLPSDDIAEEYLAKHPQEIIMFESYPNDWEDRVESYKKRAAEKKAAKESAFNEQNVSDPQLDKDIADLRSQVSELQQVKSQVEQELKVAKEHNEKLSTENDELKIQLTAVASGELDAATNDEAASLSIEVETLKADLESANAEIEKLKSDNRALKAANTRLKNSQEKVGE